MDVNQGIEVLSKSTPEDIVRQTIFTPSCPFRFNSTPDKIVEAIGFVFEDKKGGAKPLELEPYEEKFTGRQISRGPYVFRFGLCIGGGHEGEVYDCVTEGTGVPYPVVAKVITSRPEDEIDQYKGFGSYTSFLIAHSGDNPPVLPRFVTNTEIDGKVVLIMEKLQGDDLTDLVSSGRFLQEGEAITASMPFLDLLAKIGEEHRLLRDYKLSDIILAEGPRGNYLRFIELGGSLVPYDAFKSGARLSYQELNIESIRNAADIILFSLVGQNSLRDIRQFLEGRLPREKKMVLHRLGEMERFQTLSPELKYILMKAFGLLVDEGYNSIKQFKDDISLVALTHDFRVAQHAKDVEQTIDTHASSSLIKKTLRAAVCRSIRNAEEHVQAEIPLTKTEDELWLDQQLAEIFSPPPPEDLQVKQKRLDKTRQVLANDLAMSIPLGYGGYLSNERLKQYLEERPDDLEACLWGEIYLALELVSSFGSDLQTCGESKFSKSYLDFCRSLVSKQDGKYTIIPVNELREKIQPLFELREMMLGVKKLIVP